VKGARKTSNRIRSLLFAVTPSPHSRPGEGLQVSGCFLSLRLVIDINSGQVPPRKVPAPEGRAVM